MIKATIGAIARLPLADLADLETLKPSGIISTKTFEAELDPRRVGMITASHAGEISYSRDGKDWSKTAQSLMYRVVHERLTGKRHTKFTASAATDWGNKYEAEAAKYFERVTKIKCSAASFVTAKQFNIIGATPDRIVPGGHLQIKCPYTVEVVISNLRAKKVPIDNLKQIWMEMMCTGEKYAYWASYDPRMKDGAKAKMKIVQVTRDDDFLKFEAIVAEFERETLKLEEELKEQFMSRQKRSRQ